jgi:Rieske Fe-S protein
VIMNGNSDMKRRKFMEIGIYSMSAAIAAASGFTLFGFAIGPSFKAKRAKWVEVEIIGASMDGNSFEKVVLEYETKDGWANKKTRTLVYVKQSKKGNVIAISAGCTHLGCIVTWDENQKVFKCPCHDGLYDAEGAVLSGPPPAPLFRHPAKIEDGRIYLLTNTVPFGGETSGGV